MPEKHSADNLAKKEIKEKVLGVFEKYLSFWVFLCIVLGIAIIAHRNTYLADDLSDDA
jgi:ACR3 family arsenite efflux pump ArsB